MDEVNIPDNFDILIVIQILSVYLHGREFDYYEIRIVCVFACTPVCVCVYSIPDSSSKIRRENRNFHSIALKQSQNHFLFIKESLNKISPEI